MKRTNQNFFVDVWVGFHVLFLSVLLSVLLIKLAGFEPSNGLIVKGPLSLTVAVVFGRFSFRHLSSWFRHLKSSRRFS